MINWIFQCFNVLMIQWIKIIKYYQILSNIIKYYQSNVKLNKNFFIFLMNVGQWLVIFDYVTNNSHKDKEYWVEVKILKL
jgi:hypothetical protein